MGEGLPGRVRGGGEGGMPRFIFIKELTKYDIYLMLQKYQVFLNMNNWYWN
jgi:hypothetical protein